MKNATVRDLKSSAAIGPLALTAAAPLAGLMTLDECAKAIGKTPRTLRYWIALGEGPPVVYLGRVPYIRLCSWHKWLEARESGADVLPPPKPRRAVSTKRRGR